MKHQETDYLDTLFTARADATQTSEEGFPLIEVPDGLSDKLYAIADAAPMETYRANSRSFKPSLLVSWPTLGSIAATLMISMLGFQFYQQQQTLKHLEQAQADLATALHYLGEANRIARAQVLDSLNDTITKEASTKTRQMERAQPWVEPALSTETNTLTPYLEAREPKALTPNRSL
ncbi:hypothetical protein [Arenicella xantha]|uniref:Uncharacterized protein n=1 Tax=Arenicella xantha TaxID=644221 RepID=A0A395JKN2_9GAMM|nr:hypothetical protein [Arenicella xantha]RBP51261.1 hypothetical protein DFR28_102680 [Arenicella xantha]